MTTKTIDGRAETYSRPAARFDAAGNLEIRASAASNCRRALWYEATGHRVSNPPNGESLTMLEAGNALEPVVLKAMERAGWEVVPAGSREPQQVSVRVRPNLEVTGHPDATGTMPIFGGRAVIEVKTRATEAFRRWKALGAERSHPASVAQAAFYTLGVFGELRDAVIATMDTGNRTWDYEVIPAVRVGRVLEEACRRLGELSAHHELYGPDPDVLPERDFPPQSWQCRSCPFLDACMPGEEEPDKAPEIEGEEVSDEEARDAVAAYAEAQGALREPERAKRAALDTLKAWMRHRGDGKATVGGRTVSLVRSRRYSVDYRRLNAVLDPETRSEIVTENVSQHVRVAP